MRGMKIAMMSRWNATCGISAHAELVGREWVKKHDLTVFAPTLESATDWHHNPIEKEDEEFVIRGYEQPERIGERGWIDERLWKEDYDVLVIQGLELLPIPTLLEFFPKIGAKKVLVWHGGELPGYEDLYKLNFDAIVCFDFRFKNMLKERYPVDRIHTIPFPCHRVVKGDKRRARDEFGIPGDEIILFSFGKQPLFEYKDYLWLANELKERYDLKYFILRSYGDLPPGSDLLEVRQGRPEYEEIYKYLHAADVFLLPKSETEKIVVSSTVFQCLGALTPIVVPEVRYVELMDKEIVKYKYKDRGDLKEKVIRLIEDEELKEEVLRHAEQYVMRNSAEKIAERFISLFEDLRG
ncbi:MAG: glycosyltransferase family 4 protein [Candidatus Methanospirareceae archaeon]